MFRNMGFNITWDLSSIKKSRDYITNYIGYLLILLTSPNRNYLIIKKEILNIKTAEHFQPRYVFEKQWTNM